MEKHLASGCDDKTVKLWDMTEVRAERAYDRADAENRRNLRINRFLLRRRQQPDWLGSINETDAPSLGATDVIRPMGQGPSHLFGRARAISDSDTARFAFARSYAARLCICMLSVQRKIPAPSSIRDERSLARNFEPISRIGA